MAVTSALQLLSRHLLSSSPFLTSQHKTSSIAPTYARPAPVDEEAVSDVHSTLEEAEVIAPNVCECSYFLVESGSVSYYGRAGLYAHI